MNESESRAQIKVMDPVCGMEFPAEKAAGQFQHQGQTYYFCNKSCLEKFRANPAKYSGSGEAAKVTDPVCGMQFAPEEAAGRMQHQGQTYYFCNKSCLEKFRANPGRYLLPESAGVSQPEAALYTCPMDPEVRRSAPGACPKCGMKAIYFRKDGSVRCNRCGYEGDVKGKE